MYKESPAKAITTRVYVPVLILY